VWYLVAGTDAGLRTFRVSRVRSVAITGEPVERPDGFDLEETWKSIMASIDERRAGFRAVAVVDPDKVSWVRSAFGTRLLVGDVTADGRVEIELRSWSAESITSELAGFGEHIEVLRPAEVRDHLAYLGAELTRRYGPGSLSEAN